MYDNHYDATNENDYDSTDGSQKISRRELNNLKKCDTGYHYFSKKVLNTEKGRKRGLKIEYYDGIFIRKNENGNIHNNIRKIEEWNVGKLIKTYSETEIQKYIYQNNLSNKS